MSASPMRRQEKPAKSEDYVLDYNFDEPDSVFNLSRRDGKLLVKDCNLSGIGETPERFQALTNSTSFDAETWARLAEACYAQGNKGRNIRVVGRLKQERWNGQDGKAHSKVVIIAEHVEFKPEFKKKATTEETTEEAKAFAATF